MNKADLVIDLSALRMKDVAVVGGKNASLGEMISQLGRAGVRVPGGFATTAQGYREFLSQDGLDRRVADRLRQVDSADIKALTDAGRDIRGWILAQELPQRLHGEIADAYGKLANGGGPEASFAVRSSATAEDLPDASFAGQQETFLNVRGLDALCQALKRVYASLYTDRAISYRAHKGYAHADVALSAGIQRMVRSDLGASGVMFTLDTESGFDQVVFITAAYGLGETVVQGKVNPDEFYVYKRALREGKHAILRRGLGSKAVKMVYADGREGGDAVKTVEVPERERRRFSISDAEAEELARYALTIEEHYGRPMDIEWGRDGIDGKLYVLQARPETVKATEKVDLLRRYRLKQRSEVLTTGRAIGQKIGAGQVRVVRDAGERRAGNGHDGSRLGAGDETGSRDRHQPRRADLPRSDHRARARHPGGGGMRGRNPGAQGGASGDGVLRRGRHGLRLSRHARNRNHRPLAQGHACRALENHHERW
jgi:pyruvate, water dikinase